MYRSGGLDQSTGSMETYSNRDLDFMIPEAVTTYLRNFYHEFKRRNTSGMYRLYSDEFKNLSKRYFNDPPTPWPTVETVSGLCEGDSLFLHLYAELYFRHLCVIGQHTVDDMINSWSNWSSLFSLLVSNASSKEYVLPLEWLYDIINEYVYQFQSFCQLKNKMTGLSSEDQSILLEHSEVWTPKVVLQTLSLLTRAARVEETLKGQIKSVESQPLATLGYFAIIGRARVHLVLGDYRMALSALAPIKLFEQGLFTRVTSCHIMLYYCAGFAFMMLRRHADAAACFRRILVFLSRTKEYQKREIVKKHDQIVGLLAICRALCPGIKVESVVSDILNDQVGEKQSKLQQGNIQTFQELFSFSCPKFIKPGIVYGDASNQYSKSETNMQCEIFIDEVKQRLNLATGTSYLALYTSASIEKLAQLRGIEQQDLRRNLLHIKEKLHALHGMAKRLLKGS